MRFLRTLMKHWYLYLVPVILLPIVLTVYGFNKLTLYNSTALLWVDRPIVTASGTSGWNPYLSPAQNEATDMQQLLASPSFVTGVVAMTDLAGRYDLNTDTGKTQADARLTSEVTIVPATVGPNVLSITVSDKERHLAQQLVQALLTYYQKYYQAHRLDLDQQALQFYQSQLQTAGVAVGQDSARIQDYCRAHQDVCSSTTLDDPALNQLQYQLAQDQHAYTDIKSSINTITQDMQATDSSASQLFQVMDAPQVPTKTTLDKKKLLLVYTGGGLAAALALVAMIVFIRTQLDRKIYAEDDLRIIQEDLGFELAGGIVTLPTIAGIETPARASGDPDDSLDGILVPVLTALPRLRAQDVQRELRKAAGTQPAALASATTEDGK
jgi:uncharacterized protein involved in exopolysaccharide biosynthesis